MPRKVLLFLWCIASGIVFSSGADPVVYSIEPTYGSLAGGTMVFVHGRGFANDQFNFHDPLLGNKILFKSDKHQVECHITPTDVSEKRIGCETEPSPTATDGEYELVMFVNGALVTRYCGRRQKCTFQFYIWRTPTIDDFSPRAATPGTPVQIFGKIHTTQFSRLSPGFSPDNKEITRVYVGLECNPFNDETNELFGAEIDDCGWTPNCRGSFQCLPKTRTPGSHTASYLVSLLGRSKVNKDLWRVDGNQELYLYQTHSDIQSISPSSGSLLGGTVITIGGVGFSDIAKNVKVFIAGVECEVLSSSLTQIKCRTGARKEVRSNYPGSRGLLREIWTATVKSNLPDIATLESSAADYHFEYLTESSLPEIMSWERTSGYSARVTGYFVPFQDDLYRFGILSDDASELYLSLTGDPAGKTKIASCSSATSNWNSNSVQESEPISLEAGKQYYIEAYHNDYSGGHHMKIRVGMEKTQHTNAEVSAARDEKQKIRISSSVLWDKQILDFTTWNEDERVCEVQRLSLQPLQCVETNITSCNNTSDNLTLSYLDERITLSLKDTSSSILAQRLNELNFFKDRGKINVTAANVTEGNATVFVIWFCFKDPRGIELLNGTAQSDQTLDLSITRDVKGQSAKDFQLFIGGVPSIVLKPSSSIDKIEKALKRWFSVECEESSLAGRIFYKDYEGDNIFGGETGERVSDMQAFCGRKALKNPSILWKADYSAYLNDFLQSAYPVSRYKWFCFAYKGPIKEQVSFRVKYRDSDNEERYSTGLYSFIRSSAHLSIWGFSCIDVWSKINEDFGDQAMSVEMYKIEISRLDGFDEDVFVDNVWIGKNQLLVRPVSSGAMPNGFIIKDYKIEKTTETNWTISLLPANCGSPMPLFSVVEHTGNENGSPDDVTYTTPGLNSSVRVRRVQEASPPIEGMFDIEYRGNVIKDIPVNITAMRLQDLLEQEFEEGIIEVERSGHCAEFEWTFTWKSHGGNHPEVKVNDSKLTGVQVTTTVTTIQDGGLFMDPIPGEFLRVPSNQTQVVVVVNEITGSCSGNNCTFEYSADQTPTLTSISQDSGPGGPDGTGTEITLGGTGFSSNNDDNIVTIGGSTCVIISSSTGSITCRADYGPGGKHLVEVLVKGKGLADNTQLLNFTYVISATAVNPASGSKAGGQVITISGSGFGYKKENVSVSLDGSPCDILTITMSQITCRTSAHSAGIVSVDISVDDSSVTVSDAFEYNSSLTIDVTSVSPLQGSVSGGEIITISGTGFLNETSVQVGDQNCVIQSRIGVEITCLVPPHAPGKFAIRLFTSGKGFASIPTAYSTYEYLLEVHSIFPLIGSVAGGTHVTITGRGFGSNVSRAVVTVQGKPCRVMSYNDTHVICETTNIFQIAEVDNSGLHPEFGLGYEWSPKHVTCYQGDTVKWSWAGQELSKAVFNVFQTRDSSSVQYDGSGFHSNALSKTGSFSHRFLDTGVYFYAGSGSVTMKGIVKVLSFRTQSGPIKFVLDGFEAMYNLTSSSVPSTTCESGRTDSFPECNSSQAAQNSGDDGYYFTYSECSTPKVSSVTPSNGTSNTIITINGRGFSNDSCHNKVKFGSHVCDVISSSETEITCKLNTASFPVAGVPLDVSVRVLNRGYAFVRADVGEATHFVLKPTVTALSPKTGSQAGGTQLTITGDGFSNTNNNNIVLIGSTECYVITASFDKIVCTTRASTEEAQLVSVTNNGETSVCVAADLTDCKYTFEAERTPVVTMATPAKIISPGTEFRFQMSQPPSRALDVTVTIGNEDCGVTEVASQLVKCVLPGIVFGNHTVTLHESGKGYAQFNGAQDLIVSEAIVSSVTPTQSSQNGGLTITITGNGFNPTPGRTSVAIGGEICEIVTVTYGEIQCVTPPHSSSNAVTLQVTVESEGTSLDFPPKDIAYTGEATPVLISLSTSTGKGGDILTIYGSGLDASPPGSAVQVHIGDVPCAVINSEEGSVECTLAAHAAGSYDVDVLVPGKGRASSGLSFTYSLHLASVTPNESGYGGGRVLVFQGYGFDPSAQVRICGNVCILSPTHVTTTTELACEAPSHVLDVTDTICNIKMALNDLSSNIGMGFTYKVALTSQIASVTPSRGGTGGGTTLTIQGSGFSNTQSDNVVTIDGTECTVAFANSTVILCKTGPHSKTIETKVRVEVGNNGKAIDEAAYFFYVDVWSSQFTWGYNNPPEAGTFVTIKKGQTILLDQDTPVLKFLLIQGGALMFDMEKPSLHLQAENILITDGGCLQVGTEDDPFPGQALITLHGHVRSREMPVFGTKTIALREGKLDLHGLHVPITWTHLSSTAEVGATRLHLVKQVTWKPGDQIILAPTGKSQREFEELTITAVLNDNYTLEVSPPLKYKHISIVQTFDNIHVVETRAEVGLLTRNVRVRGSVHSAWTEIIEACEDEFRPGQFQTQTCFQGKFGEEVGSDEFGVQIMIHAPEESKNLVTARFSYAEISHAGQAFRLGRYPIHFHLSGDVSGSYVRGCAIHHSFNRAITMHGIHNLHVSHNVVFNVRGNCFFMEDGIETGNVVEYNLGIFVIASTSALNVDITPATYWVTNANNTVRHNAAAGGSHFGFWYQMFEHPDGPSFRPDYCPRNVFMLEFFNNSAHSFGRYGLWIFPVYHPMEGGGCKSIIVKPAVFGSFIAYNNMRGAEAVKVGAVQMHDFKILDNDIAGIEYVFVDVADAPRGGPKIKNALIVGHSQVSEGLELKIRSNTHCTTSGLKLPQFSKLVVDNVTFVNFDREGCTCYSLCAQCEEFKRKGGWSTYAMKNRFVNSPRRSSFRWSHESVIVDLDGTLTGYPNGSVVPLNANLPPGHCFYSPQDSYGPHNGSVCDSTVKFRRFAFNKAAPESLMSKNVLLENRHGMDVVPFCIKCTTHPQGWVTLLILGEEYNITFENAWQITNITYSGMFYDMEENDSIWIKHRLVQTPDHFTTTGVHQNKTDITPPANSQHGSWSFVNETKVFTYIASGKNSSRTPNGNILPRDITVRVYRCFYEECIVPVPPPPPKGRPEEVRLWSNVDDWEGTEPMYGGYGRRLPTNGSDVMIQSDWYMVADIELPYLNQLLIYGTLEIDDRPGMVLNASIIFVTGGLIVGWPDQPFLSNFMISLQGNVYSEDLPLRDVNVGSKALAVFGFLWMHGRPKRVYWTDLAVTAEAGDRSVILSESVDWIVGDEIVITSTTVEPQQTEKFIIKAISQNGRNLTLDKALQYKHIAETHTAGNWTYTLAAEVGLLTRNLLVEGANNPADAWDQSFGCRVLIGRTAIEGIDYRGSARIENVEFKRCGQEGWVEDYDPRFALAFLNTDDVEGNTSYVSGNSFHDGFNTGIGVFGTNNLTIKDNIVHHTVGPSIRVIGEFVSLLRNLAVYSLSIHTYNGRKDKSNLQWPGAIEVDQAKDVILINNTVAGSERFGFKISGEKCSDGPGISLGNEVHGAWHGMHLPYEIEIKGCSMLSGYMTWRNFDYGIFLYGEPSVIIDNVISVENTVGMFPNVWGPHALSHPTADKYVIVRNTLIVGTSPGYDCAHDSIVPYARQPYGGIGAKKAPGGGKIGITTSQFSSAPARGPIMTWESPHDYSAVNGYTLYHEVTFFGFQETCGKRHRAIMSNEWAGDIIHPMDVRGLHFISVDEESKLLLNEPTLRWVNPSDCVDMDCDARRQILIRDLDGSFTGAVGGSVISKAEYEWDGDKRYGLGDYRVPKPATTLPDGTRLDMSAVAANKGIVRGTRDHNMCSWYGDWNAYKCSDIDYRMLVIESLDPDTETRRLSPVALIANGYVNLLNGPMDHGWCLGYTCQERISTFYGIVATGTNYSLYFTSNEPQKLRLHLLNSDSSAAVRVGIFYHRPQRQDVYREGRFINPTNTRLQGSEFTLIEKPANAPDDYFEPPLTSISGANYYDRELATLFVVLRGSEPVDINVMPVVKVQIGMKAVSIDDFFKVNLVNNLADLLGIDKSLIRVVNIVSADGNSRRRRRSAGDISVEIEIADPPAASNTSSSSNYTGVNKTTSYDELKEIGDSVVENVQTGQLARQLNTEIVSLDITDPIPEPVDPTGGVRATNETYQQNITGNSTLRYDEVQAEKEAEEASNVFSFLIPSRLEVMTEPSGGNETVPFTSQPKLKLVDVDGKLVTTLGHGSLSNWTVMATIQNGTGDSMAVLDGNVTVTLVNGWANFTDLSITHNGSDYKLFFYVNKPAASHFNATSQSFEVKERILYFTITTQPDDANETVSFRQQPRIEVRDSANDKIVDNTGWKRRRWLFTASLANPTDNDGHLNGTTEVEFVQGVALFSNLSIDLSGENYILALKAKTDPASSYTFSGNSSAFNVSERVLYLKLVQQPSDCNDTVICGSQPIIEIRNAFPDSLVDNIGWRGRTWSINATMVGADNSVVNGTTLFPVETTGRVEFQDLSFFDTAQERQMKFSVITEPASSYSGLSVTSQTFNVSAREFYLEVITQPDKANQSEIFGVPPVVELRDLGTRARGHPLKGDWSISASLKPSASNGTLSGVVNVTVEKERAEFNNLSVSFYGIGYKLIFESNQGHMVLSQPFEVLYVNDYSPVFDPASGSYDASISEDVSIGTTVTTVTATDQDSGSQGDVSFSLVAGNTGNKFSINSTTGVITTIGELDRETTAVFTLTVRASDGAVPEKVRSTDGQVVVTVSDINDNTPSFNNPSVTSSIQENAAIGDVVITLNANDPDEGLNSKVLYSIIDGNEAGIFTINSTSGEVKVNASVDLDQEPTPDFNHSLVVLAQDMGTPSMNTNVTLNISITPVNEFTPQLQHNSSFNFSFAENVPVGDGVFVFDVNATDQDYGEQGRVTFAFSSGNDEGKFSLNASTGELTLASSLDYETSPSYTLRIHARDNDQAGNVKYAFFTVYVSVLDLNDNAPTFSQSRYEVNVDEDTAVGLEVFTFLASDPDGGLNGLVSYSILLRNSSEFSDGLWSLNSSTGKLTLNASLDMDNRKFSTWTHTLVVRAQDAGTPLLSSNTTLIIHVILKNEFAPSFASSDVSIIVAEDIAKGSVIYDANATDADFGADGEIVYSITDGNNDLRFMIDAASGIITNDAALDREVQPTYDLVVTARDQATSSRKSGTTTVHISLKDVNDNTPTFVKNFYSKPVDETVTTGGEIITLKANDPDSGSNSDLTYSIASGNDRGFFSIESKQGIVRAAKDLDLETQNHTADRTYQLVIFVEDGGTPVSRNSSVSLIITVQNVNDFTPVLEHADNQIVDLSENTSIALVIFDVNATDGDYGEDGVLTYSLTAGNSFGTFDIDNVTGVITLAKELDFETVSEHNLEVTVSDSSLDPGKRKKITAHLRVRVINIDDSGMYTAKARMIHAFIASPLNPAGLAGVPHKSDLEVLLAFENGTEIDITSEGDRYTVDDSSKSNGLFSATTNGGLFIVANDRSLFGTGKLIVHVTNVNSVEVNVTVVGSNNLTVSAVPYPETPGASKVTELKQVISGHYQRVLLKVLVALTNGQVVDVSSNHNTTFTFKNAQQIGGKYEFGPSPNNLFSIEGIGLSGEVLLQAEFARSHAAVLNLPLSSKVFKPVKIVRFGLENVNMTLSGFAIEKTTSAFAELLMDDGSSYLINNFTSYSGLLSFSSSNPGSAKIDALSGVVTLVADSSSRVTITASLIVNASVTAEFAFYCNLEPKVGEVDIGEREGPPIPTLDKDDTWKMPIRVNPGSMGILAVQVEIQFDSDDLQLERAFTSLPYDVAGNVVTIFGPVAASEAFSESVGELSFTSKKKGVPEVMVQVFRTVNKELSAVPSKNVTVSSCSNKISGDVDVDCTFDIVDVAFISAYITASSKSRFTDEMRKRMDVDWNEVIEVNDAFFLSLIYLKSAKFVTELTYQIPDHNRESSDRCGLEFSLKLANKDGSPVTNMQTEVYFVFSHQGADVGAQLARTTFSSGTPQALDGASSVVGLIKASFANEKFIIATANSELEATDVGVTILQETPIDGTKHVVAMFSSSNPVSKLDAITWAENQAIFAPQRKLQLSESTKTCNENDEDPLVTVTVELTFDGDYDQVIRGKEEQFQAYCENQLSKIYPDATFSDCRVRKGSIIATFNMTLRKSKKQATIDNLWDDVKEGLKFEFNGATLTTRPIMRVDDEQMKVVDAPKDEDGMALYIIIIACVAGFLAIFIVVIVIYCRCRKGRAIKVNPTPPETPDIFIDSGKDSKEKESKAFGVEAKDLKPSGSATWSVHSSTESTRSDDKRKYMPPVAFAETIEPAFEEVEEPLPSSESPKLTLKDDADRPKPILAFSVVPSKQGTPRTTPNISRKSSPVHSSKGSLRTSEDTDTSPVPPTSPELSSSTTSSRTEIQSPDKSLPALEETVVMGDVLDDDDDDDFDESLRKEAFLRRRTSSVGDNIDLLNMPGFLVVTNQVVKRRKMQIKVIRPNAEMGILAHVAGIVNAKKGGTLAELREDINHSLPGYLGSVRYLFISRKMKIIDPRTETQLVLSALYKKTVYVKVFHGAESCEYFCLCGKPAQVWCKKCNTQGYCGDVCKEQDEEQHSSICTKSKARAMENARTRRVSKISKK